MSGHSKWSTIKHKKALTDAKKSKVFSKLARLITIAAKEKGGDLAGNPTLRMIVEKAKAANMPSDNVERAIKKGTGELEGVSYEEFIYEAYGPEGTALIMEGVTDNKNRTFPEIKAILSKYGAKMAEQGSVSYLFNKKGVIEIIGDENKKEENELLAIENGAEDMEWSMENTLVIYTIPENLIETKNKLENAGFKIESAGLQWLPLSEIKIEEDKKNKVEKLFEALDDHDDIQDIYSNLAS